MQSNTSWLVPDDTANKGTSKRHRTEEKTTHITVHVPTSIFDYFKPIPLNPAPIQLCVGLIKKLNVDRETCTALLSVFLGLVPTQKTFISC